jgi:hypothetical protein
MDVVAEVFLDKFCLHNHSESGNDTRMPPCTTIWLRNLVLSLLYYTGQTTFWIRPNRNGYFCRQMEGALQLRGRVREMDSKQKLMGSGSEITVGITVPPTMKSL